MKMYCNKNHHNLYIDFYKLNIFFISSRKSNNSNCSYLYYCKYMCYHMINVLNHKHNIYHFVQFNNNLLYIIHIYGLIEY